MKKSLAVCLIGLLAASYWGYSQAQPGPATKVPPEQKDVYKTLDDLAAAFNKQDAKAIGALYTEAGVYTSVGSGERIQGRAAIEADFAAIFMKQKNARLTIDVDSVRMITADVASVEGTARVATPKETPSVSEFQTILVKKDGRWLVDSVRETELPAAPSGYEHLKELDWLVGEYVRKQDKTEAKVIGKWVANNNFLSRHYSLAVDGVVEHSGTQIIGWDPIQQKIRSWTFDADGTFGEGLWEKDGKRWTIRASGVLPDGKKSSVTQIMTQIDDASFNWQTVARTVDGQFLPNIGPVVMQKVAAKATKGKGGAK